MLWKPILLAAAIALGPAVAAHADEHHHHELTGAVAKPALDDGKKWQTDIPLREAMDRINQAMAEALPRIHGQAFSAKDYRTLAETIHREIGYAIEHCRLDARTDAMLHKVIAKLESGAQAMEGKTAKVRHGGAVTVVRALQDYGSYFDHPGWQAAGS